GCGESDDRKITTQYTYDPFGNATLTGQTSSNSFTYTGRELDVAGLYFYRSRFYNPTLQRFISEDPTGMNGGVNLYNYVGNNPIGYIDPLGLMQISYNTTYSGSVNGESWWQDGKFSVAVPPVVRYDCKCVGNGKWKLNLTVNWDINIMYNSNDQLVHEEGHSMIF